jgi:GR25 family glycosyltransferase involved in LPS biosynthesis
MKLNTYVIHYTKLKERKDNIISLFNDNDFNLNFIEEFDKEEITKENIRLFYNPNKELFDSKISPLWDNSIHKFRYLTYPEASCAIKQVLAIKQVSEQENEYALIIEDDVLPKNSNFSKEIENVISNSPKDWDAIFIGEGCGEEFIKFKLNDFQKINDKVYKANHPATNCAEAYILKKSSAQKIYENIIPFQLAFDWELAYIFYKLKMNIYWAIPPIFVQGSKNGTYNTSIQ